MRTDAQGPPPRLPGRMPDKKSRHGCRAPLRGSRTELGRPTGRPTGASDFAAARALAGLRRQMLRACNFAAACERSRFRISRSAANSESGGAFGRAPGFARRERSRASAGDLSGFAFSRFAGHLRRFADVAVQLAGVFAVFSRLRFRGFAGRFLTLRRSRFRGFAVRCRQFVRGVFSRYNFAVTVFFRCCSLFGVQVFLC